MSLTTSSRLTELFAREVLGFLVHKELLSPKWGGTMKIIAFLTHYAVVDRIIDHLKLTFVTERAPLTHLAYQEVLTAVKTSAEYFSCLSLCSGGEV